MAAVCLRDITMTLDLESMASGQIHSHPNPSVRTIPISPLFQNLVIRILYGSSVFLTLPNQALRGTQTEHYEGIRNSLGTLREPR